MTTVVRDLTTKLSFETDTTGLRQYRNQLRGAQREARSLTRGSITGERGLNRFGATAGRVGGIVQRLGTSLGTVTLGASGLLAAITAGGAVALNPLIETIARVEQLKTSLVTITGSVTEANTVFARLEKLAASTPVSVEQLASAFTKLSASGLDSSDEALISFVNTASALGKDFDSTIEAVVDAGTFQFERLKEAFTVLSSQSGNEVEFQFRGVKTTLKKDSAEIVEFLKNIGETAFAGGAERQSKTLIGLFSTLLDGISRFAVKIGDAGLREELKTTLRFAIELISQLGPVADTIAAALSRVTQTVNELLTGAGASVVSLINDVERFERIIRFISFVLNTIEFDPFELLVQPIKTAIELIKDDLEAFARGSDSLIGLVFDKLSERAGPFGAIILGLSETFRAFLIEQQNAADQTSDTGQKLERLGEAAIFLKDQVLSLVETLVVAFAPVIQQIFGVEVEQGAEGVDLLNIAIEALTNGLIALGNGAGIVRDEFAGLIDTFNSFIDSVASASEAAAKFFENNGALRFLGEGARFVADFTGAETDRAIADRAEALPTDISSPFRTFSRNVRGFGVPEGISERARSQAAFGAAQQAAGGIGQPADIARRIQGITGARAGATQAPQVNQQFQVNVGGITIDVTTQNLESPDTINQISDAVQGGISGAVEDVRANFQG